MRWARPDSSKLPARRFQDASPDDSLILVSERGSGPGRSLLPLEWHMIVAISMPVVPGAWDGADLGAPGHARSSGWAG
jgi:hypothetical protein